MVPVVKRIGRDGSCYGAAVGNPGFRWPAPGNWVADPLFRPDRSPYGLHGLAWGRGNPMKLTVNSGPFLVVLAPDVVDLGDHVKFRTGFVLAASYSERRVVEILRALAAVNAPIPDPWTVEDRVALDRLGVRLD
jgi:hypothetical protein